MPKHFFKILLCCALIWQFSVSATYAQVPDPMLAAIFKVQGVTITIEDTDIPQAKAKALLAARNEAAQRLLQRVTPNAYHPKWQKTDKLPLPRWIQSTAIRNERTSNSKYSAEFDFTFRPTAVQDFLAEQSIPCLTQFAPEFLLLPVYDRGDQLVVNAEQNLWFQSWQKIAQQQRYGLVPFKLPSPAQTLQAADIEPILNKDKILPMAAQMGVSKALVLRAKIDAATDLNGTIITVMVDSAGLNPTGTETRSSFSHQGQVNQPMQTVLDDAAIAFMQQLEGEWKDQIQSHGAAKTIEVVVPLRGIASWVDIWQRLRAMPNVQDVRIRAITVYTAQLSMYVSGTDQSIVDDFRNYNFRLEPGPETWILSSN